MDPYTITATDQAELLAAGKTTSQELVQLHYQTIKKHDDYLHAMIATRDLDALVQQAKELDEERRAGNLRSPLHGVPILLKV